MSKMGSDHSPLEVQYSQNTESVIKPFKFLKFWTKYDNIIKVVKEHWVTDFVRNPMFSLHQNLIKFQVCDNKVEQRGLWDISQKTTTTKEIIHPQEIQLNFSPTEANREALHKS